MCVRIYFDLIMCQIAFVCLHRSPSSLAGFKGAPLQWKGMEEGKGGEGNKGPCPDDWFFGCVYYKQVFFYSPTFKEQTTCGNPVSKIINSIVRHIDDVTSGRPTTK